MNTKTIGSVLESFDSTITPHQPCDIISFGGFDWIVLDTKENAVLLITRHIFEICRYHCFSETRIGWADCHLRGYLNGEFYSEFSEREKAEIISENGDNVFLLNYDEFIKYRKFLARFGDSTQLQGRNLIPELARDEPSADEQIVKKLQRCWWWLRSSKTSFHSDIVCFASNGEYVVDSCLATNDWGVRPALWLRV